MSLLSPQFPKLWVNVLRKEMSWGGTCLVLTVLPGVFAGGCCQRRGRGRQGPVLVSRSFAVNACLSFTVLLHPVLEEQLNPYKSQQITERVFERSGF